MRFTIYQESRQGGRHNNEDRTTYCYSRDALLMVVADGMGGHHYGERKNLGPWSDIYSVGASMYACLAGSAPLAADERLKKDTLTPAMVRWEGQFSDRLLEIIDWCLNLNHLYRPQSVFALQKALVADIHPPHIRPPGNWLGRFVGKFRSSPR